MSINPESTGSSCSAPYPTFRFIFLVGDRGLLVNVRIAAELKSYNAVSFPFPCQISFTHALNRSVNHTHRAQLRDKDILLTVDTDRGERYLDFNKVGQVHLVRSDARVRGP